MEEKHSVWVGSLSSSANEEILSDLFGKFGPVKSVVIVRDDQGKSKQFGFVNYYNREVAECAAHVMDGYVLLQQAVKTKGPRELQKLRADQSSGKKDYRMFTDCLFFIDGRNCTWKSGECPFRHCQKAKETEHVCEKWLERQCEDSVCQKRHPRLTRNGSMITDTTSNRCPSHNAFKCFGECGNKDCNTHFLEQQAYHDHVKMVGKKSTHSPIAACDQCQAVFFSDPEQISHRCYKRTQSDPHHFTSTRVEAEKDIAQPITKYPTKRLSITNPETHVEALLLRQSTNHSRLPTKAFENIHSCLSRNCSSTICNNVDRLKISSDPQTRNFDSSSTFNRPQEGTPFSWRQSETRCTISNLNSYKNHEPIGVFWDFENCPVPKGKSALAVVQKLRSVFFKDKREVEFMCVCDICKEKKAVIEELNKAQVTVVHINSTSKNAADDKLRQSLRRFAQTYCHPATVILISGDGNFAMDLSDLRHRHKFQIICLHNNAASSALLGFAHETHRFDLFAEDLETFTALKLTSKSSLCTDVLTTNLPLTKSATLLKSRLTKLSDNCGGKVLAVSGTKAIIRFPNSEAASRARRRLDKEELFGSILRATLLPPGNHKNLLAERQPSNEKGTGQEITKKSQESPASAVDTSLPESCSSNASTTTQDETKSLMSNINNNDQLTNGNFQKQNLPINGLNQFPRSPIFNHHFHNFPSNGMYGNLFHSQVLPNLFHLPASTTPPLGPINSGVLSSPGSFTPVVPGAVRRSPSPEQQFTGVDLLVTNINESVSKKEIKKKLASIFREHCKVYSVVLHARVGATLRAFVKVPKVTDAHLAISKVNGKLILGRIVHVSIASEKDKELCYLQDEVVVVLQAVPLNWLPLATFLQNFEQKYRRCLDVRHLEQLRDVAVVHGSAGCQTISLLEGKVNTEPVVVDTDSFASDVFKLLHHYEGLIQLAFFPALYWLEFHKEIQASPTGMLLAELLCGLPNIMVVGTGAAGCKRSIQWIKPTCKPCDVSSLFALSCQVVDILVEGHDFEITIEQLQERYLSSFGKPLEASSFGFHTVIDLLSALPSTVEIKDTSLGESVSLTRQHRVKLFAKEIEELLLEQPDNTVLLSNFMASYVKNFGQKFKVASFGFSRLTDLIKAIPDVAEFDGVGDQRVVTLVHKKKKSPDLRCQLDDLTQDLTKLLNSSKNKEISLDLLMETFYQKHGRRISLTFPGCATLEGLLSRLTHVFQIVTRGDEKFLQFSDGVTVDDMRKHLVELIENQENKFIYVKAIPKAYEKLFSRKLPFTMAALKEALPSMTSNLQICGSGNDQIISLSNDENAEMDLEFVFAKTAVEILYEYPEYTLSKFKFLSLFRQRLPEPNMKMVMDEKFFECISCCVVVRQEGREELASLKRDYCIQLLIEQIKELLSSSDGTSFLFKELPRRYQERFRMKLDFASYGFRDVCELKDRLQGYVEVISSSEHADDCMCLSAISRFEVEAEALLKNCEGCISLNRFAPAYQQMFSKPCVVADYGYSKLASLLNAIPHVARIIGNGPEKAVISVKKSIPERVCADLLSVRIVNEENGEVGLLVQGNETFPKSRNLLTKHHEEQGSPFECIQPQKKSLPSPSSKRTSSEDLSMNHLQVSKVSPAHVTRYGGLNEIQKDYNNEYLYTKGLSFAPASLPRSQAGNFSQNAPCESNSNPEVAYPVGRGHQVVPPCTVAAASQSSLKNPQRISKDSDVAKPKDSTMSLKWVDDSTSSGRSTPQKVRLAANFTLLKNS